MKGESDTSPHMPPSRNVSGDPVQLRVAVQQRHEFFRAGLPLLLGAEPNVHVVGSVTTPDQIMALCRRARPSPDVALVDSADIGTEQAPFVGALRRDHPAMRVIALHAGDHRAAPFRQAGFDAVVPRVAGIDGILRAMVADVAPATRPESFPTGRTTAALTTREAEVLALVRRGATARDIAEHLAIRPGTVEHHKRRIFMKLGVKNQAHAVAVALRAGLFVGEQAVGVVVPTAPDRRAWMRRA